MSARVLSAAALAAACGAASVVSVAAAGCEGERFAASYAAADTGAGADAGADSDAQPGPDLASAPLVGDDTIEPAMTSISPGLADAFAFAPRRDGDATHVVFYVDASSNVGRIEIGVYADFGGRPGALLAVAELAPTSDAWARAPLSSAVPVHAGERVWIAALGAYGSGGNLVFRTRGGQAGSQALPTGLTTLPSAWGPGAPTSDGPASVYLL